MPMAVGSLVVDDNTGLSASTIYGRVAVLAVTLVLCRIAAAVFDCYGLFPSLFLSFAHSYETVHFFHNCCSKCPQRVRQLTGKVPFGGHSR